MCFIEMIFCEKNYIRYKLLLKAEYLYISQTMSEWDLKLNSFIFVQKALDKDQT